MGKREAPISPKQIALLHVAKKELGLDDGAYRSILSLYGGAESAKNITQGGFSRLMDYLVRMGFKAPAYLKRRRNASGVISAAQMRKIKELFASLGMDMAERQQGLCRRVIKKPWAQTRSEANKIVECLKAMLKRQEGATEQ